MIRYYIEIAIAITIGVLWQYGDISAVKIKAILAGMAIVQCYILYELIKQNEG